MARYRVELTRAAQRDLTALPKRDLRRIDVRLLALAEDPYPPGVEKLSGSEGLFRVRVGDYRILYQVEDDRLVVLVVRIRHRREAYRGL